MAGETEICYDRDVPLEPAALQRIAQAKEKEWREVTALQQNIMQSHLESTKEQLEGERAKLTRLKEDFKYNLKLLEERDTELDAAEEALVVSRGALLERERRESDLLAQFGTLREQLQTAYKKQEEARKDWYAALDRQAAEFERRLAAQTADADRQRAALAADQLTAVERAEELEQLLQVEKQELASEWADKLRCAESDAVDRLANEQRATQHEATKVALLERESAQNRELLLRARVENVELNERIDRLTEAIKCQEWHIQDTEATHAAEVTRLESELTALRDDDLREMSGERRQLQRLQRQQAEDRLLISNLQRASQEEAAAGQTALGEMRRTVNALEVERDECRHQVEMERSLREQQQSSASGSQNSVVRSLEERVVEVEKLKTDLANSLKQNADLERRIIQVQLDAEERTENTVAKQGSTDRELLMQTTKSRDTALARCQQLELQLEEARAHGIPAGFQPAVSGITSASSVPATPKKFDAREDATSATALRAVIKEMREQMEQLQTTQTADNRNDYIAQLESEVSVLKTQLRQLSADQPTASAPEVTDTAVRAHINELNSSLHGLRAEKLELVAQCRRQQSKLLWLEEQLSLAKNQPDQMRTQIDQLRYELSSERAHQAAGTQRMDGQVKILEGRLAETRAEAEHFHQAALEAQQQNAVLSTALAEAKLENSEERPRLRFGGQELLIQQLEDRLACRPSGDSATDSIDLQKKLQLAVQQLVLCQREKQQMAELGNRLRAQLRRQEQPHSPVSRHPVTTNTTPPRTVRDVQTDVRSQLENVEALQYELTRRELMQQRRSPSPKPIGLARSSPRRVVPQSLSWQPAEKPSSPSHAATSSHPATSSESRYEPSSHTLVAAGRRVQQSARSEAPVRVERHSDSDDLRDSNASMRLPSTIDPGDSVRDVWRLLDDGASPSFLRQPTPRNRVSAKENQQEDDDLAVTGQAQTATSRPARNKPAVTVPKRSSSQRGRSRLEQGWRK